MNKIFKISVFSCYPRTGNESNYLENIAHAFVIQAANPILLVVKVHTNAYNLVEFMRCKFTCHLYMKFLCSFMKNWNEITLRLKRF